LPIAIVNLLRHILDHTNVAHTRQYFNRLLQRLQLYFTAAYTGLRASELASLTRDSFDITATPPALTVEAAYSKHKRRDVLPLHPDVASTLAPWLAGQDGPLWPGNWAKYSEAVELVRHDLKAARTAWIAEAVSDAERTSREQSDFLSYRNHKGEVADFHAFRHRFITEVVRSGVLPGDAKELARHSTITLTMDHYNHVSLNNTAEALNRLSVPNLAPLTKPHHEARRAAESAARFEQTCQNLMKPEQSGDGQSSVEGVRKCQELQGFAERCKDLSRLEEVHPVGFEPTTFGSVAGSTV
jgi:integrase